MRLAQSLTHVSNGRDWITRRPVTTLLAGFFIAWYAFQRVVLQVYGDSFARWLFYNDLPPRITGGLLFSPLSHDLYGLGHISGNVALLLCIGGLAEPYIGSRKVAGLVIAGGYIGMVVTMLSAPLLGYWPIAGASTGILILWGYTGLRLGLEFDFNAGESSVGIEEFAGLFLAVGIPAIPIYELLVNGNMGHLIGIVLGVMYFVFEAYHDEG